MQTVWLFIMEQPLPLLTMLCQAVIYSVILFQQAGMKVDIFLNIKNVLILLAKCGHPVTGVIMVAAGSGLATIGEEVTGIGTAAIIARVY